MTRWLSVLVPSNRPEGLERFIDSLIKNADNPDGIEIVVLVDDDKNYVEYNNGIVTIHHVRKGVLNVSELQNECYKVCTGDWIMLGNDDVIMETPGWDSKIKGATEIFDDGIALIWPNDCMFGETLACFPIFSRRFVELTGLFPMSYRRYKVDDTIFHTIPSERKIYLNNVILRHKNDNGKEGEGYKLPDGRIYPIDQLAARHDEAIWSQQAIRRSYMKAAVNSFVYGEKKNVKVLIGVPTGEMARRADFYDYFNAMTKPEGCIAAFAHGQSPARNRNLIIQQALENNCSHVLFLDDDIVFKSDLLVQLLKHDKDMVTGLMLMRNYPHTPLIFNRAQDDGRVYPHLLRDGEKGLIEIVAAGLGCILIKTEVFAKVESPWIRLGELEADQWCDDIGFFHRARAKGFKLYCDLDLPVGHIATMVVTPGKLPDGQWVSTYDTNGTSTISVPQEKPQLELIKETVEK